MDYVFIDNKENKKQVIFTGCGGMISYYFGIAKFLQEKYDLSNIIFGGVSGGAVVSTFLTLEQDVSIVYSSASEYLCENLNKYKTGAIFNTINIMENFLLKYFDSKFDCEVYKKLNNNLFISVSFIYPSQNTIVCKWNSNTDLINCITSSSALPLLGYSLFPSYRNSFCFDGALFNNEPILYKELPTFVISPYKWRYTPLNWYLISNNKSNYDKLFELGYHDACNNSYELDDYFTKKK